MLREWERYWRKEYKNVNERVGKIDHMDEMKNESWRQFQVFMECYDSSGDCITLASDFDDCILYPMAVFTMLDIFEPETYYDEYCEFEFSEAEWESIDLNEDDYESPTFYIRLIE